MIAIAKIHAWRCMVVLPKDPEKGRAYNTNTSLVVCATTLSRAVEMIVTAHPDATIWSCSHISEGELLLDSSMLPT